MNPYKFIITTTVIAAMLLLSIGCSKEEASPNVTQITTKIKPPDNPILGKWFDDGTHWGCDYKQSGNCLPEAVIFGARPLAEKAAQNLYFTDLILNQTVWMSASQDINDDIIQGLNSGIYAVDVLYNSTDDIYYVLIVDQTGNTVYVLPYTW